MMKPYTLIAVVAAASAAAGCGGMRKALGVEKAAPDEFRVVTKAPLVIPPDYALRPPRPGDPRPQELRPDADARAALFGQDVGRTASEGEKLLVSKAGAEAVDPAIRAQVDLDGGAIVRKPEALSDAVLNYGRKTPEADSEEARLQAEELARRTVGTGAIVIGKPSESRSKLPGL